MLVKVNDSNTFFRSQIASQALKGTGAVKCFWNVRYFTGGQMMKKAKEEKVRVQFDFTRDAYNELISLQKTVEATTRAETIRYALRTLQWLLDEISSGRKILVEQRGQLQEIVFPFLGATARRTGKPEPELEPESDKILITQ
jgi:hypothetical protein